MWWLWGECFAQVPEARVDDGRKVGAPLGLIGAELFPFADLPLQVPVVDQAPVLSARFHDLATVVAFSGRGELQVGATVGAVETGQFFRSFGLDAFGAGKDPLVAYPEAVGMAAAGLGIIGLDLNRDAVGLVAELQVGHHHIADYQLSHLQVMARLADLLLQDWGADKGSEMVEFRSSP